MKFGSRNETLKSKNLNVMRKLNLCLLEYNQCIFIYDRWVLQKESNLECLSNQPQHKMANTPATYNTHKSTFQPNQIIQNRLLDTARYKVNTENLSDLLALVKRKKKLLSLKIVTKSLFSVCLLLNEEFKQLLQKLFSS